MLDRTSELVTQQHSSQDAAALELLRLHIEDHQKADASRSVLKNVVGSLSSMFVNEDISLEELQNFYLDQQRDLKDGKKVDDARIHSLIESDSHSTQLKSEIVHYGSNLLKTACLFSRGKLGLAGTVALFALDQIRPGDSGREMFVDALMGATKGALTRGTFHWVGERSLGVAAKGVTLGVSSRILDLGLTRQTYLDPKTGNINLKTGLENVLFGSLGKTALATDVITFGAAHGLFAGANRLTHGALEKSALMKTMFTGTTFGFSSGATGEIMRQRADGEQFDLGKVIKRASIQGALDTLASVPGGVQADTHAQRYLSKVMRSGVGGLQSGLETIKSSFVNVAGSIDLDGRLVFAPAGVPAGVRISELAPTATRSAKHGGPLHMEPVDRSKLAGGSGAGTSAYTEVAPKAESNQAAKDEQRRVHPEDSGVPGGAASTSAGDRFFSELNQRRAAESAAREEESLAAGRARARRSKLADPEILDGYVENARKFIERMEDFTPLLKAATAEPSSRESQLALAAAIKQRKAEWQELVDDLADSGGWPRVKVKLVKDSWFPNEDSMALFDGDGRIKVRLSRYMGNSDPVFLTKVMYQEFMHHEQLSLVIRKLAQDTDIDKGSSQEKLQLLQLFLMQKLHATVSEKYIVGVLEHSPRKLTKAESNRAAELADSFAIQLDEAEYGLIEKGQKIARQELRNLFANPNGAQTLLERLAADDFNSLAPHLLAGGDFFDNALLLDYVGMLTAGKQLPVDAREQILAILIRRENQLYEAREDLYQHYRNAPHELEAYAIEELVEQKLRR